MEAIVSASVENYISSLHKNENCDVLLEMEALAQKREFPIIGRSVGAFLEVMALAIGAKRIFEFGSGFGYAAYWFSRAVGPEGKVICTDGDVHNCQSAKEFLSKVHRWQQVEFLQGWAQDIFKEQSGEFDMIFCDVDKGDYPEVWKLARNKLRKGGIYVADNSLWYGRVAQDIVTDDVVEGWTEAVKEHNNLIAQDNGFKFFVNPERDGLIAAIKL